MQNESITVVVPAPAFVTSDVTAKPHQTILCDSSSGTPFNITLPNAAVWQGA
jgi:hypothetical protein